MRVKQLWTVIPLPSKLKFAVSIPRSLLGVTTDPEKLIPAFPCDTEPPNHRVLHTCSRAVPPPDWASQLVVSENLILQSAATNSPAPRYTQHQYASDDLAAVVLNSTIVTMPLAVQTDNDLLLCKDLPTLVGGPDKCTKAQFSTATPKRSLSAIPRFDASGKLVNVTMVDSDTHLVTIVPKQCVDVLPWVFQS